MITARAAQARAKTGVFAVCLDAWVRGGDEVDALAGALVFAETIRDIRRGLIGGK